MREAPRILRSNSAWTDAAAISVNSGVLRILSDFAQGVDSREQFEGTDNARKKAISEMQTEMFHKASQLIGSKFSNLSRMTQKGRMDTNNNLEQWKERYRRTLDSNLKLIEHCRLLLIPENLAQKVVQTALRNIHKIMQDATLDLANSQMKIYENPDSWSADPTVKIKVMKGRSQS
jgi:hypothetical protein